jgi:hypothetical protein
MKSKLIPLALNELLCRPLIVSFNCRSRLPARSIQLSFSFDAERHNVQINRERAISTQAAPQENIMKEMLSRAPVE